jgi:hypothetical protein
MTHQESQDLKSYLEQQFGEVRERFANVDKRFDGIDGRLAGIDGRLAGIDTHLDRQDIDFNKTTMNLLRTINDATKESRRYAARLFGVLDRPLPDTADAPKAARPRRLRRPGTRPEK